MRRLWHRTSAKRSTNRSTSAEEKSREINNWTHKRTAAKLQLPSPGISPLNLYHGIQEIGAQETAPQNRNWKHKSPNRSEQKAPQSQIAPGTLLMPFWEPFEKSFSAVALFEFVPGRLLESKRIRRKAGKRGKEGAGQAVKAGM